MKKFPRTPSMKGYILQFMAILSLLGPKICLASVIVINAPYQFALLYLVEYLFLLMHNIILYRDFCGNHSFIKNQKSPTKSRSFKISALDTTTLITLITPVFYQQPTSTEPRLRLKDWEVFANTVGKLDRQNWCK